MSKTFKCPRCLTFDRWGSTTLGDGTSTRRCNGYLKTESTEWMNLTRCDFTWHESSDKKYFVDGVQERLYNLRRKYCMDTYRPMPTDAWVSRKDYYNLERELRQCEYLTARDCAQGAPVVFGMKVHINMYDSEPMRVGNTVSE